jgi:hypothetical protein
MKRGFLGTGDTGASERGVWGTGPGWPRPIGGGPTSRGPGPRSRAGRRLPDEQAASSSPERYFTEPAVSPPTRCFSITANRMTTGTTAMIEAAKSWSQLCW